MFLMCISKDNAYIAAIYLSLYHYITVDTVQLSCIMYFSCFNVCIYVKMTMSISR